jgi:hypothetical protein
MRKIFVSCAILVSVLVPAATASAAPNPNASCVGTFSSFFAQQGIRAELAQDFAQNARPAGRNVYSHVAQEHGGLEECFAET